MRLRGPAKGTMTGAPRPALAALPSGAVRRHVLVGAAIERGLDLPVRDALARTGS
jgi:hypothetical protein